jgi:hypothetical protein
MEWFPDPLYRNRVYLDCAQSHCSTPTVSLRYPFAKYKLDMILDS